MTDFLELIKKHGSIACLAFGLVWMNDRLSTVEKRLYNCLERQYNNHSERKKVNKINIYAILPKKETFIE